MLVARGALLRGALLEPLDIGQIVFDHCCNDLPFQSLGDGLDELFFLAEYMHVHLHSTVRTTSGG